MIGPPFRIFSWHRAFLPNLARFMAQPGQHLESALLIVPHKRPWRYLVQYFTQRGYQGLLPEVVTLAELLSRWSMNSDADSPDARGGLLDQVALLHRCVIDLSREDPNISEHFSRMNLTRFLPWGIRLAALLDELLQNGVAVRNLLYVEAEVSPPAAALLGALGRIYDRYQAAMARHRLSTKGIDYSRARGNKEHIPECFRPRRDRPVFIAGLSAVDGIEEELLRALWGNGANICLHTDPAIARGEPPHQACIQHQEWIARWKASTCLVPEAENTEPQTAGPQFFFYAGYDYHSQLAALGPDIERFDAAHSSSAVVLADNGLLMPVLHHLPTKDVNVSMGYPLDRAPLSQFLKKLLRIQIRRSHDGRYYLTDILYCLRHPIIRTLRPAAGGQERYQHDSLYKFEKLIDSGERLVDITKVKDLCHHQDSGEALPLLCLKTLIQDMEGVATLEALAGQLERVLALILELGADIWKKFPLDAEALTRLSQNVLPQLRYNLLAGETLDMPALLGVFTAVVQQERIPFEADPITGVQVLGMLETRLLHFDNVFILDATEDKLPGKPEQNPLLPDSLRFILGLPDVHERERTAAHNLYRLCAGARNVFFYWQEGISRSALFDGKKARSRFVEQLIWHTEQKQRALLVPEQNIFRAASCTLTIMPQENKVLQRTSAMARRVGRILHDGAISATMLDCYLRCPLRFARQYILGLSPNASADGADARATVGNCIHNTLKLLYEPYLLHTVRRKDITTDNIRNCLEIAMSDPEVRQLPIDSYLMLETAAVRRLKQFVERQPEETTIIALEKKHSRTISANGASYVLAGTLDRVDKREGRLLVIDYKTGRLTLPARTLWTDDAFFRSVLRECDAPEASGELEELFQALRAELKSIQLPCYLLLLLGAHEAAQVGNACLVDLKDTGREQLLFANLTGKELDLALSYCELSLALILRHMENAAQFAGISEKSCQWCPYVTLCAN